MSKTVIRCSSCSTKNRVADDTSGRPRCSACHHDLPWLINTDAAGFDAVIKHSSLPVLVDLWAPWCGPCRAVAPALEKLSVDRAGKVRVVKVNIDESPNVSARLGVQSIPTMVLFSNGTEIARQIGALPGDAMGRWVDQELSKVRS